MRLTDYLLDHRELELSAAFAEWRWLIPREFTLWFVTCFADCFLVLPDDSVHMLQVDGGTLTRVAADREDFSRRIDEDNNANEWLSIPLVDKLTAVDVRLSPGQCYGFRIPPVLGGSYELDNIAPISISDYLGATAQIYRQLNELPDGSKVRLDWES